MGLEFGGILGLIILAFDIYADPADARPCRCTGGARPRGAHAGILRPGKPCPSSTIP